MPRLYLERVKGQRAPPEELTGRPARPPGIGPAAQILPTAILVACAAGASLFAVRSTVLLHPGVNGVARALLVLSWGTVGLVTWKHRPHSRLGPVLIVLSCLYALTT